jgi:hypothetical protein
MAGRKGREKEIGYQEKGAGRKERSGDEEEKDGQLEHEKEGACRKVRTVEGKIRGCRKEGEKVQ